MWSRKKIVVSAFLLVGIISAFSFYEDKTFSIQRNIEIFVSLFRELHAHYVDELNPQTLVKSGIDGMLDQTDPYTQWISAEKVSWYQFRQTGQYVGMGFQTKWIHNKLYVSLVFKQFPAYQAGIRVGDELLSINDKPMLSPADTSLSHTLPNTLMRVSIKRNDSEKIAFSIPATVIQLPNIAYAGLIKPEVGYLHLQSFTQRAGQETQQAVQALLHQGAKKIVLDLRDNPGGSLMEAVQVLSCFLPKNTFAVEMKGRSTAWNKEWRTLHTPLDTSIPLLVLVNENTASAAEVVAGVLQDYDRAVIVGRNTFGKALVQTERALPFNQALRLTVAKYYLPSERCIQKPHKKIAAQDSVDKTMNEFFTKNKRKVYAHRGIQPDKGEADEPMPEALLKAEQQGELFLFASQYVHDHPTLNCQNIDVSDADLQRLSQQMHATVSYTTPMEEALHKAVGSIKNSSSDFVMFLTDWKKDIQKEQAIAWNAIRPQVKKMAEEEIAYHYQLHECRYVYRLAHDAWLTNAIALCEDSTTYNALLHPR